MRPWGLGPGDYHEQRLGSWVERARRGIFCDPLLAKLLDKSTDAVWWWRTHDSGLPALSNLLGGCQPCIGSQGWVDGRTREYSIVLERAGTARFVDSPTGSLNLHSLGGKEIARGNLVSRRTGPGSLS